MTRLIDADALITAVLKNAIDYAAVFEDSGMHRLLVQVIAHQPTIDAEPVRHGKWKWLSCDYDKEPREKEYECSECHHKTIVHGYDMPWEKYCPECGARMDRE